jgi:hypothetical protein
MSHIINKVIVPRRERKATERGGRKGAIQVKAKLFASCWEELKNKKPKFIKTNFMTLIQKHKTSVVCGDNSDLVDDAIGELYKDFFSQPKRVSYFRAFDKMGSNIMFCTDETIKSDLKNYIRENDNIKSKKHISNIFNDVYLAFYAVGRERKWCDQEVIVPDLGNGVPVINAGNPLNKEVENDVYSEFEHLAKQRPTKLMVKVEGDISSDDEQDVANKETLRLEKQGLPASIAMIYYVIMRLLAMLFDMVMRLNDKRRMENLALLIMLWSFTMHEGARPGDTMFGSHHKNLIFWFGEQYSLLTLAFVKIETLEYLLKGNYVKRFYFESWKGKLVRSYRGRWHCFAPNCYSSIDMAWIYIVVMRVMAFVSPSNITSKIFNKETSNLSEIRRKHNLKMKILNLVMYSIRYAFAEEAMRYLLEIPRNWVRYVMGHFPNSHMSQRYANNLNQRVEVDNIKTLLGSDVCNDVSSNEHLPLRFRTPYSGVMENVPADVPQHVIDDLNEVKRALNKVLANDGTVADSKVLMARVAKSKVDFMAEIKRIPFGEHFVFKDGLLNDYVNNKLTNTVNILKHLFAPADKKEKPKHVLWSYGQVMFGEWHDEEKGKAIQEFKDYKEQKMRVAMDHVVSMVELPFPKQNKRKAGSLATKETNKLAKKPKHVEKMDTVETVESEQPMAFYAKQIEKGDIVVIMCNTRDSWSIQVPNTSKSVWVCYVRELKVMTNKVRVVGNFYKGSIDELTFDHNSCETVYVRDSDIAHLLSGISKTEAQWFEFEDDELKQVINFCG